MDVTRVIWTKWLLKSSLVTRYPALVYLTAYLIGSVIWRVVEVQWVWYERDLRTLPFMVMLISLSVYLFRSYLGRVWRLVEERPWYWVCLSGCVVFGCLYTASHWQRTEFPAFLLKGSEGSAVQILGEVVGMDGVEVLKDATLQVRPISMIQGDSAGGSSDFRKLSNLRGKIMVRRPVIQSRLESGSKVTAVSNDEAVGMIHIGDIVVLVGELQPFEEATNPGQFDFARYQRYRGFCAQMWEVEVFMHSRKVVSLGRWLQKAKFSASRFFANSLSEANLTLVMALLTGETDYLSEVRVQDFRRLGLSHLLAISGLHLGFVVGWVRRLLRMSRVSKKLQSGVIVAVLWLAVLFVGARPSALRVGLYLSLVELGDVLKRPIEPLNLLAVTAWVILLINPLTVFLLSFQLSFVVYLSILVLYAPIQQLMCQMLPATRMFSALGSSFALSLAAFLGSLPIVLFQFFQIPLSGILMNLWAVPLTGVLLALILLTLVLGLLFQPVGVVFAQFLDSFVGLFQGLLDYFAKADPFVWQTGRPLVLWILLFYLLCWLGTWWYSRADSPLRWRKCDLRVMKKFLILALAVFVGSSVVQIPHTGLEWVLLDVGQGDGMYMHLPNGDHVLIDGGGKSMGPNYVGEQILKPFLLSRAIRRLDLICITHFDADHVRGLLTVLEELQVGGIWAPAGSDSSYWPQVREIAERKGIPIYHPVREQVMQIGSTLLEILHPKDGVSYQKENDRSIVMRLTGAGMSVLLTGDIGEKEEQELIQDRYNLKADFLKVGHHGSKYSTAEGFVSQVRPSFAVISVGENRYGHPASEVIERLQRQESEVLRTDERGAIRIFSRNGRVNIRGFNKKRQENL